VPSTLAPSLGVGDRRTKSDRRDADALSRVSCRIDLPSVHIPSKESRERKVLVTSRAALVRSRTLLINSVRGWLRSDGRTVRSTSQTFVARMRIVIEQVPEHIERVLVVIEALNGQIKKADQDIASIAENDELCRRLMTVPGIGPVTAVVYKAVLDDIRRFKSAHVVESYLGLVPGEHSSGDKQHRLGITKAGSSLLRRLLTQCAWAARRSKKLRAIVDWSSAVEKRRGKHVANLALARKLAGLLFALWRDGTEFDFSRG
jgi:transposase